jgi:hypothetical protein
MDEEIWKELPSSISRLILEKHLQTCHKQKSIQILVNQVLQNMTSQYTLYGSFI